MNIPPTLSSTLQAIKNGGCLLRGEKSHGLWVYVNWTHNTFYAEFFRKIREREYAHCCLLSLSLPLTLQLCSQTKSDQKGWRKRERPAALNNSVLQLLLPCQNTIAG